MTATSDAAEGQQSAWQALGPLIDLVTPFAVRAVAALRLADLLADGPLLVGELAERSETDPDALRRVLRHLICHGLFTEPSPDTFGLNETAALLRSDHPSGMRVWLALDGFGGTMDVAFTGLLHTLRTGKPAWETVFGTPFWEYLADNPAMSASFDQTMSASAEYIADAAGSYDWSGVRHVIDVGGGRGVLVAAVLAANPDLRATLVDLPDTAERGRRLLAERGLAERCEIVGQSFFDPLPAGADVYVLNSVVHDWPDDEATAILRRCAEAAGERGRVLVLEQHSGEGERRADFAEMDLRMLVLCGGRERTLADYTALAATAGLTVSNVDVTPIGQIAIECTPATG